MGADIKILIVDDGQENLLAMEAILSELGHTLITARSGREALKHLLATDFAVVLMDVLMPEMSGFETAQLIRERERSRSTPIIFLSAMDKSDAHVSRGYALGAVDFLFKPINPEILKLKVMAFVNLYIATQEAKSKADQLRYVEKLSAEIKLDDARQKLESMQQRESLIVTLTHDLKTPLIAAVQGLELMMEGSYGAVSPDQSRMLSLISHGLDDLLMLIQNLLEILRNAYEKLDFEAIDLLSLTSRCLSELEPLAQAHNLSIENSLGADLPFVWVDKIALYRVLMNLFSNAIKFTPDGGTIEIAAVSSGEFVTLSVKDSGEGIAAEEQAQIFQQFWQGSQGKNNNTGTGLGLYLCQKIIESLKGKIEFFSNSGCGTTFCISLPSVASQSVPDRGISASEPLNY